ncbi:MAG TPA: GGDEF domain-containing protein [Kineosporiaceae bacterium]|nr:GGDEF domain-containing protein [Kineosporiaceae bacterium]
MTTHTGSRSDEILPLNLRARLVMVLRILVAGLAVGLLLPADRRSAATVAVIAASHLAVTGTFTALVPHLSRSIGLRLFGVGLLLDAVFLQYLHEALGPGLLVDVAIAANLVAVCLIASFRTGLKIWVWQSLLLITVYRGEQAGLWPTPSPVHVDPDLGLTAEILLLALVVLTTAVAAATNERELRRRRYDAHLLADFTAALHAVDAPGEVLERLVQLIVTELGGQRALICEGGETGLRLLRGSGLSPAPPAAATRGSALLQQPDTADGAVLARSLAEDLDPWLSRLLPGARRVVAVRLPASGVARWLVFEHAARSGLRVERRVVSAAVQAAATTALAYSRTLLLQRLHDAATRDGLTGVANRRSFDTALARLTASWRQEGRGFALVLVDVDRFKSINDRWGHPVGDQALQAVAATLRASLGPGQLAARYGGEEFALLLPGRELGQAAEVAERARLALHEITQPVPVTASFGVAALHAAPGTRAGAPPGPPTPAGEVDAAAAQLIEAADAALLRAKAEGRDRVLTAADPA